jgi:hypothetical protein
LPSDLCKLTSSVVFAQIKGKFLNPLFHSLIVLSSRLNSFSNVHGLKIYFVLVKGELFDLLVRSY